MNLSEETVLDIYQRLIKIAKYSFEKGNYLKSLNCIVSSAFWMYRFNIIYYDYDLETILHRIAKDYLIKYAIEHPKSENVVFIDNFGFDNRGLTQQYLRGLMGLNKRILYIIHNSQPNENSEIIRELKEYKNAEIKIFKTNKHNLFNVASEISNVIKEFSPKDILIHIAPWDVVTLLALSSISGAVKYNINLTDHAYWLGSSFIDYNIEFRGYGEQLSIQKRNLPKSKLINLPYYPIVSKYTSFQGFPELPSNSIIVFCGGSEYKMLGKNGIFFKLMDSILEISDKVYILVAGINQDSNFAEHVSEMKYKDRVYLIGTRADINEVFAHSDIYLSSYPLIGGLMTQYAALNHLPILAYAEPEDAGRAECLVNHFDNAMSSKESLTEFKEYAKRLIDSSEFRKSEGDANYNAMMNEEVFGSYLKKALYEHKTDIEFFPEQPNYEEWIRNYLEIENNTHEAIQSLVSQFKLKSFQIAPMHTKDILLIIIRKTAHKIFKHKS